MTDVQGLAKAFAEDFTVGVAVSPRALVSHGDLILRHFASLTAENQMKPQEIQPEEGCFTFGQGDRIAEFARVHGLALRGHTLVWHNQTPDWFFVENGEQVSRETALRRMDTHIRTVTAHYRGLVNTWDVVNEAVNDREEGGLLRDCPWKTAAGEDYLAHAFRFARKADPEAKLCYNDYNEAGEGKSMRIYELVKTLRAEGVPVDCIGMQGHHNCYGPSVEQIGAAMERYASLGVRLQVTELDVSLFRFEDETKLPAPTEELLSLQADYYAALFRLLRDYRWVVDSVTFWGAADDVTWLSQFPVRGRKNWPLLFDDDHMPKKAYDAVMKVAAEG